MMRLVAVAGNSCLTIRFWMCTTVSLETNPLYCIEWELLCTKPVAHSFSQHKTTKPTKKKTSVKIWTLVIGKVFPSVWALKIPRDAPRLILAKADSLLLVTTSAKIFISFGTGRLLVIFISFHISVILCADGPVEVRWIEILRRWRHCCGC